MILADTGLISAFNLPELSCLRTARTGHDRTRHTVLRSGVRGDVQEALILLQHNRSYYTSHRSPALRQHLEVACRLEPHLIAATESTYD